jgi:hypothetical protein
MERAPHRRSTTMSRQAPLPTFLIIGAQKSATRWLRHNLGLHPEVYVAPVELEFFNKTTRFRRGVHWYRKQFAGRALRDVSSSQTRRRRRRFWRPARVWWLDRKLGWSGEPVVGEATPGYMMWRHDPRVVASRIKRTVPDVRLIAVLRNPVDRANSALVHHIRQRRVLSDASLLDLVRAQPPEEERFGLVSGGWYAASLKPYRHLFGDQLLVLLHDDVRDDPHGAYERALRHIGAAADFAPPDLDQVVFSNQEGSSAEWRREVSPEERWELYPYFRDDVRKLERMIGRDLSIWKPRRPVPGWSEPTPAEIAGCFRVVKDWAEVVVRNVSPGLYERSVPGANGSVRILLNQLIGGAHLFAAALSRGDWSGGTSPGPPDLVADDPAAQYRAAACTLQSALDDSANLVGAVTTPFKASPMPALVVAGQAVTIQLVSAWELASATGQEAPLPPRSLEVTSGFARRMVWDLAGDARFSGDEGDGPLLPIERFVAFLDARPQSE